MDRRNVNAARPISFQSFLLKKRQRDDGLRSKNNKAIQNAGKAAHQRVKKSRSNCSISLNDPA
jgi:hypothetical protein